MAVWTEARLREALAEAARLQASDVHLKAGWPPVFRVDGILEFSEFSVLCAGDTAALLQAIVPAREQARFAAQGEADFAYAPPGAGRFRVHAFRALGEVSFALRRIADEIPPLEALGLPAAVGKLAELRDGLVLVVGAAGAGKSTTLAALLRRVGERRACHILTLEEPVEYLHAPLRALVRQREVGADTPSFAQGLRAALREDPDVLLVGELRDEETAAAALAAAETGHLVLTTLHAADAVQAVERLTDLFPARQAQARRQLAAVLRCIVAQRLLPRLGGGRVCAAEVLLATAAARNLIREGKAQQLYTCMQTGAGAGMQTMEAARQALAAAGLIASEGM